MVTCKSIHLLNYLKIVPQNSPHTAYEQVFTMRLLHYKQKAKINILQHYTCIHVFLLPVCRTAGRLEQFCEGNWHPEFFFFYHLKLKKHNAISCGQYVISQKGIYYILEAYMYDLYNIYKCTCGSSWLSGLAFIPPVTQG